MYANLPSCDVVASEVSKFVTKMENQRRKQRSVRKKKEKFAGNQFTVAEVGAEPLAKHADESNDDDFLGTEDEVRPDSDTVELGDITPKARLVLTASQRKLEIDLSLNEDSNASSGEEQEVPPRAQVSG